MILQEHKRKSSVKEAMYRHYPTGKRIRELEQKFEIACKDMNHHQAEYYHREINRLYKEVGISE